MDTNIGRRASAFHPLAGRVVAGTITALDADHYHAVVNGRTIYRVRWDNGSEGSGWEIGGTSGLTLL